jgi:glyoxylase-like metal-dependent hydrolase (beta-lactamase superfamily II)
MTSVRIDHAVSSGTFTLDGETFEVDNNIWVIGDGHECLVIDAPHDVDDIVALVGGRTVKAIVCTHAHDDHVRVAPALRERVVAPILLHPADRPLWELTHTEHLWDVDLSDGQTVDIGDTLFQGGPGATGRSFSDEDVIKDSIREVLFALPDGTVVHTGHGEDTTIGAEKQNL